MPKEYIHNRYYGQHGEQIETDADGREVCKRVVIDDSAVKVGWSKEAEHVEIAVVFERDSQHPGHDPEAKSWHAQMDRAGLNRLIRTLRKARDAAFGADA